MRGGQWRLAKVETREDADAAHRRQTASRERVLGNHGLYARAHVVEPVVIRFRGPHCLLWASVRGPVPR